MPYETERQKILTAKHKKICYIPAKQKMDTPYTKDTKEQRLTTDDIEKT